jgi:tetratricopeptide (TPR) repeat protein
MYLRGSKWNMTRRRERRGSPWRIVLLLILIGGALYVNQIVVPATPPLFLPTATPTRDPESFISEADDLFAAGKLSQAIAAYEQAVEANPGNPALYLSMARAQLYAGRYENALESAERAQILNNDNPLAHALKAWALDFLGDYTQAEASVNSALELDVNSALAHAIYAEILIDRALSGQGDINAFERAAEESQMALSLDANLMEAHRARGYVLWNTGNFTEAVVEYQAALAINDKIADLYLALGSNYHFLQLYPEAVQAYLQAYALNPQDSRAPYEISITYSTVGDFSQSVQYADQAVKTEPQNPRMHGNLGVMYYKNNQLNEAAEEFALAIHGGTLEDGTIVEGLPLDYGKIAEYYAIYGLALAKLDRCGEAVPLFQAVRNSVPDDSTNVYNAEQGLIMCEEGLSQIPTETGGTDIPPEAAETPEDGASSEGSGEP